MDRRLQFVRFAVGWMAAAVLVLVALDAFSAVLFYVVSLIGFFLVYEATATAGVRPRWRRRVQLVGALLLAVFVAIAAYQIWLIVETI